MARCVSVHIIKGLLIAIILHEIFSSQPLDVVKNISLVFLNHICISNNRASLIQLVHQSLLYLCGGSLADKLSKSILSLNSSLIFLFSVDVGIHILF